MKNRYFLLVAFCLVLVLSITVTPVSAVDYTTDTISYHKFDGNGLNQIPGVADFNTSTYITGILGQAVSDTAYSTNFLTVNTSGFKTIDYWFLTNSTPSFGASEIYFEHEVFYAEFQRVNTTHGTSGIALVDTVGGAFECDFTGFPVTVPINDNQFNHAVVTLNGSHVLAYINGVEYLNEPCNAVYTALGEGFIAGVTVDNLIYLTATYTPADVTASYNGGAGTEFVTSIPVNYTTDILAYYPFDGDGVDLSVNALHLTNDTYSAGIIGDALDTINGGVLANNFSTLASFDFSQVHTIDYWFYKNEAHLNQAEINTNPGSLPFIRIKHQRTGNTSTSNVNFEIVGADEVYEYAMNINTVPTQDLAWNHVVATWTDFGSALIYVNGVLVGTLSTPLLDLSGATPQTLSVGGLVDNLLISNVSYTQSDVTASYNGGAGTEFITPPTFAVVNFEAKQPDGTPILTYCAYETSTPGTQWCTTNGSATSDLLLEGRYDFTINQSEGSSEITDVPVGANQFVQGDEEFIGKVYETFSGTSLSNTGGSRSSIGSLHTLAFPYQLYLRNFTMGYQHNFGMSNSGISAGSVFNLGNGDRRYNAEAGGFMNINSIQDISGTSLIASGEFMATYWNDSYVEAVYNGLSVNSLSGVITDGGLDKQLYRESFNTDFAEIELMAMRDATETGVSFTGFAPCIQNWVCDGYSGSSCLIDDTTTASCNSVNDTNTCGEVYVGNYSEFINDTGVCDFCTPSFSCDGYINTTCIVVNGTGTLNQACNSAFDNNTCYSTTLLPSDQYIGTYAEFGNEQLSCEAGLNAKATYGIGVLLSLFPLLIICLACLVFFGFKGGESTKTRKIVLAVSTIIVVLLLIGLL